MMTYFEKRIYETLDFRSNMLLKWHLVIANIRLLARRAYLLFQHMHILRALNLWLRCLQIPLNAEGMADTDHGSIY